MSRPTATTVSEEAYSGEPTNGLEPLTCSGYERDGHYLSATEVLLAELRSYPRYCKHGSQADPSEPTLFILHYDLP
jgi:hypothetical protein